MSAALQASDPVLLRRDQDHVAYLTLNRAQARNALSVGLMGALEAALAGQIASKSPLTLAFGKAAFYRQAEMDLASAYALASETMTRNMMARDAAEGIDAFLGKRQPTWTGT